jgi:hypothetical protein
LKNNYFLLTVLGGLLVLIGLRFFGILDPGRKEFVQSCTAHGLYVIEKACRDANISSEFTSRATLLENQYVEYCSCLADAWRSNNLKLRPAFFEEQRVQESERSSDTKKIQKWISLPATKSAYARCFNSTRMNLNWMADAHMRQLKSNSKDKSQPRPR